VSNYRQQALINAPVEVVWELLRDVNHHAEWWPNVVEAECDEVEQGCEYRNVVERPGPLPDLTTTLHIEKLDDCEEVLIRCMDTGTYTHFVLTEARGGTFVDAEFGTEPKKLGLKVFDVISGKRYFRRWGEQSLDALRRVAVERGGSRVN
jgi:uncharacterized protein YndB with AHSA1/START domain